MTSAPDILTPPRLPASIISLKPSGGRGTLVFLPDLGGSVLYARSIVARLHVASDILGMRLDEDLLSRLNAVSLQDIAQHFARDLQPLAVQGPLHLAGHSFSGFLAFETACALTQQGADVGLLALFDSGLPPRFTAHQPTRLRRQLKDRIRLVETQIKRAARNLAAGNEGQDILHEPGFARFDLSRHPPLLRSVIRELYRAMVAYHPSTYSGRVTLFVAIDQSQLGGGIPDLGWSQFVSGGIDIVPVTADHLGVVSDKDVTAKVAQIVQTRLDTWNLSTHPDKNET